MDVLVLIDKLDDLVHNAKAVPLTDQVRIDREEIYDILDQMRATIPEEIKQARWIVKERQEMLAEAKREVDRLLAEGHEVRALDNFTTGRRENLDGVLDDIELVEGDIQSYERAHTAVRGCDIVLHQAALPSVPRSVLDPLTSNASNVIGTLNLLLAARDSGVRSAVAWTSTRPPSPVITTLASTSAEESSE